jgi:hypothetical protein
VDATSLGVMNDTRGGDGMGLYPIPDYPGQTTYGYDGGMRGYGSKLVASTNHPAVVVVLINDKEADFVSVAGRLLDVATK